MNFKYRSFKRAIVIVSALGMFFTSCKKEKLFETTTMVSQNNKEIEYVLDEIPLLQNKQDVNQLMKNDKDKDEEKLNMYLYEIGLATRDLIKDAEFNHLIIDLAIETGHQSVYLLDLKIKSPKFYTIINNNLSKKGLSLEMISNQMTHKPTRGNPEFPITMEIEKYEPIIFIPNLEYLDRNKQPLISPNIETDCEQNSAIEDFIVTWFFNNDGRLNEIILGEETSLKTSNPLFLIDHGMQKKMLVNQTTSSSKSQIVPENITRPSNNDDRGFNDITSYRVNQIGIKSGYGYESSSSNRSEFACVVYQVATGYYANPIFSNNGDFSVTYARMYPGGKNVNYYFGPNYLPNYDNFALYWNTFERDWNRGIKTLGSALNVFGAPGTIDDVHLYGKMRYNSDWYMFIPSTVQIHALPFNFYQWETQVNFNCWKSNTRIYSVQ